LSDCSITEEGYTALAEALKSNPTSHLIELDLSGNDPGASGVKQLMDFLNDSKCTLKTLRLLKSSAAQEACNWLHSVVGKNSLLLKELDLSRKEPGDSGVEKLSALMKDSHCKLQKIQLSECNLTERSCWALHTVLSSESSKLTEVDLSSNPLEDSGVKQLCAGLKSPNCKLEKLSLSDCSITEEGYTALAEALKSSHLIELDLRGNDPGASGVKLLTDLLQDPDCKLNTLRQKLRQALGGQVVLPDDWETTAEVIRETGRKVLGVSSGRRKEDKETWWWNKEVQDSIQRKRLAKKKWDMDRTEENRQEYKGLQRRVKREVSKAKQKAYEELYTRLDTREGEKDLYRLARQRD
ncbi:hypothetical protein QTP70_003811, partial [Hemibagrus guttatus]